MMGYLDDVHIAYATEGEIFEPVAPQPISGEPFEVKLVEPCPDKKPPQICIIDAETQQTTQVTSDLEFESTVWLAWSPDGQQIVFDAGSVPETGRFDHKLYLINADGSGLKQLTSGDTNDIFPAWSPDGNLIAFHRNCSLWVVRPDGSQPRELLGGTDKFCASTIEWSPDSQRIAFLNKTDDGTVPYQVFVLDPGETVPRLIHAFDRPQEPHLMSWSRDGRQLALWFGEPDQEEVFLINADGSGEPKLMDEHIMEAETVWTWLPNFWPRWGDEQGASSSLPPPDAPKSDSSAPDDPWGQVVIPPGGTVNLAFVGALSGDIPDLGEVQQNAFLMALDDLPTVKEFPVEASIIADGGCTDPDLGRQAAELVVSEPNIVGVVGHSCSPSCAGGAPVYEQAHLVLISPSCTSSDLTEQSLEVFNRVVVRDDRGGDEVNLQITDTPAYQEFADRYQRHYSQTLPESDLAPLAAYAYDATALLIKTIEFVSVVDGAGNLVIGRHALAEAVRAVPGYQGVTGVIGFDSKGDRQLP
jgi:ABC-type branched-subunit amino acid transport system substrate-binding protein